MKDILNSLKERLLGIWRRFQLPLILAVPAVRSAAAFSFEFETSARARFGKADSKIKGFMYLGAQHAASFALTSVSAQSDIHLFNGE